ncbi:hypothetical protein ABTX35_02080 [Streptomyces sp. NPDC096080]|uniref:putative phage holin n=1 Tax=Streptomyces sp. NPDC096080 TaxID=3156693 RepID=UPI0033303A36
MTVPEWANACVSGVVLLAAATFMAEYHRRAPWRSSGMGWYLMAFVATIGLLATYTVVMYAIGLHGTAASVMRLIRSGLLLVVAGLLVQGTRTLRRQQPRPRKLPGRR